MHLRVHILPVLADRRLDAITQRDLVALKNRLVDRKQSTAAEILKTLKCVLNRAVKLAALDRLPVAIEVPLRIADNGGGVTAVAAQLRHRGLQMATRYVEQRASASEHALRALEK